MLTNNQPTIHDDLPEIEAADYGDMDKARVGIKYHGQFPATNLGLSAVQRDTKGSSASLHSDLCEHFLKQTLKSFPCCKRRDPMKRTWIPSVEPSY